MLGPRRLYSFPTSLISLPNITKFAATKNVGAKTVDVTLEKVVIINVLEMRHEQSPTYCIRKGVRKLTFLEDQRRPVQPITSPMAAVIAVGIIHHVL
jgi:hypothetical protein